MLRLPPALADRIRHLAWEKEISANAMATILLRQGVDAPDRATITDRLQRMGVR